MSKVEGYFAAAIVLSGVAGVALVTDHWVIGYGAILAFAVGAARIANKLDEIIPSGPGRTGPELGQFDLDADPADGDWDPRTIEAARRRAEEGRVE